VRPRVSAKLKAWERSGLLGPQTIRTQISVLEKQIEQGWSAEVSGDLTELQELLEDLERGT
jgi:hypothetical protein